MEKTLNLFNDCKKISAVALLLTSALLSSCSSLGASGPSAKSIRSVDRKLSGIMLVDLNAQVTQQLASNSSGESFAAVFGGQVSGPQVVGTGDILDVAIWEAPPAALFGSTSVANQLEASGVGPAATAHSADIPEQMVDNLGQITVPFVGTVNVSGRTPRDIALEIAARLRGKAHDPQVIVRIADNHAANVTIVGEVGKSGHMPLTSKGERLLDAIASAGGVKQQVDKVTIQLSRDGMVASEPLASVIANPQENIQLKPNDVVTALYQPYSFQALGAFNTNTEVQFEATGLTLAQALGRIGGLQDNRANIKGVFIFRLEDTTKLGGIVTPTASMTVDHKVPVIYRVDLSDPTSFFTAQGFQIRNGDVLYVSNAPLIDIQKFVTVITSTTFSIVSIGNAVK